MSEDNQATDGHSKWNWLSLFRHRATPASTEAVTPQAPSSEGPRPRAPGLKQRRLPSVLMRLDNAQREIAELREKLKNANWETARDYLLETRQMREFLMWEARRNGMSADLLPKYERALDKITYHSLECDEQKASAEASTPPASVASPLPEPPK